MNNCGLFLELDAILAVVVGGTSLAGGRARLLGALAGVLIMQTITTSLFMHDADPAHAMVVKALAAVAVCMIYTRPFQRLAARMAGRRVAT